MWEKLASILGGSVFSGIAEVVKTFKADPTELIKLEYAIKQAEMEFEAKMSQAQNQVNAIEAASTDKFSSRWRPAAGWLGVAGLAYAVIVYPMFEWASYNFGWMPPPKLDTNVLVTLLLGMLGLGAMRSYDKKEGTSK